VPASPGNRDKGAYSRRSAGRNRARGKPSRRRPSPVPAGGNSIIPWRAGLEGLQRGKSTQSGDSIHGEISRLGVDSKHVTFQARGVTRAFVLRLLLHEVGRG